MSKNSEVLSALIVHLTALVNAGKITAQQFNEQIAAFILAGGH